MQLQLALDTGSNIESQRGISELYSEISGSVRQNLSAKTTASVCSGNSADHLFKQGKELRCAIPFGSPFVFRYFFSAIKHLSSRTSA